MKSSSSSPLVRQGWRQQLAVGCRCTGWARGAAYAVPDKLLLGSGRLAPCANVLLHAALHTAGASCLAPALLCPRPTSSEANAAAAAAAAAAAMTHSPSCRL